MKRGKKSVKRIKKTKTKKIFTQTELGTELEKPGNSSNPKTGFTHLVCQLRCTIAKPVIARASNIPA
ncbi:uncharacterized protein ASCRUDRAFT_126234 [Ascoidea rubescens DSM 1968]|uniref:Uncharacterized protein n=1 Tax=Ascoidea rubescens DSM 1968 TaxID=1344418 RepID=A0A1D2VN14_9ASCO|nr:hypothetical protein ASCRUDRAFT_126234 [Ascoidea rubescens DSM 1968]ODV62974.1 hypothetical protein ASCRUDRAFT_126234 [Ascoidea rubescens DSM 1968]